MPATGLLFCARDLVPAGSALKYLFAGLVLLAPACLHLWVFFRQAQPGTGWLCGLKWQRVAAMLGMHETGVHNVMLYSCSLVAWVQIQFEARCGYSLGFVVCVLTACKPVAWSASSYSVIVWCLLGGFVLVRCFGFTRAPPRATANSHHQNNAYKRAYWATCPVLNDRQLCPNLSDCAFLFLSSALRGGCVLSSPAHSEEVLRLICIMF